MGFRIALDLGDLGYRLPAHALAGVPGGNRFALQGRIRVHVTLGDVRVVRHRDEAGACASLGLLQPLPQVLGILALVGAEWLELPRVRRRRRA